MCLKRRRFAVQADHLVAQPGALLGCPCLFELDLFEQRVPLTRQRLQHCPVDVAALAVGLTDLNRKEWRTRLDKLPLGHIDRCHEAFAWREYLRYADCRYQKPGD